MPRPLRPIADGLVYHVINRGNARQAVFFDEGDYAAFLGSLADLKQRNPFKLYGYCLMSNHIHLLLRPKKGHTISRILQSLLVSHTQRYHRCHQTCGHVWQGRFKAFPIEHDEHLLTVMRYVERNPVRATSIPVRKAQRWPWSSIGSTPREVERPSLHPGPVPRGKDWLRWVNEPQTEAELGALRETLERGRPFGNESWQRATARQLGLESAMRPRGRPRKQAKS